MLNFRNFECLAGLAMLWPLLDHPPPKVALFLLLSALRTLLGLSLVCRLLQTPRLEWVLLGFILATSCLVLYFEEEGLSLSECGESRLLCLVIQLEVWLNVLELGCMSLSAGIIALYCMLHHLHAYAQPLSAGLARAFFFRRHFSEAPCLGTCPICLEDITAQAVASRHCRHRFHRGCIERALDFAARCPLCRHPL